MRLICLLFGLCAAFSAFPARAQGAGELLVFAASSLTDVMTDVGEAYAKSGKPKPVFFFAVSSALARPIENGAPAGMFISADVDLDELAFAHFAGVRFGIPGAGLIRHLAFKFGARGGCESPMHASAPDHAVS
jgi:hypothetical protein